MIGIRPSLAVLALAAAHPAAAGDREDLLKLEAEWNAAIVARDVAVLDRILADDFLLVWIDGSLIRKPAMLSGAVSRKAEIDPFRTEDVEVRLYGDTAIVTGRFAQTVRLGEKSETNQFRYTDVYVLDGKRWRAVSAQAALIKSPRKVSSPGR